MTTTNNTRKIALHLIESEVMSGNHNVMKLIYSDIKNNFKTNLQVVHKYCSISGIAGFSFKKY